MTHDDDRFPDAIRRVAAGYNEPPELNRADMDAMWSAIEVEAFREQRGTPGARHWTSGIPRFLSVRRLLPVAAALVLGVAIGRFGLPRQEPAMPPIVTAPVAAAKTMDEPYQSTASRYLGQATALLVALPAEVGAGTTGEPYRGRAHDLLLTTRLLLDSPAAADPRFRTLLEDLELVLAQVVRLQSAESGAELELIRQALEQRDVLPRLRTAVADISADD